MKTLFAGLILASTAACATMAEDGEASGSGNYVCNAEGLENLVGQTPWTCARTGSTSTSTPRTASNASPAARKNAPSRKFSVRLSIPPSAVRRQGTRP